MDRLSALSKIANKTLSTKEYEELNFILSSVYGWDAIDAVLLSQGLTRGKGFSKNKYILNRGLEQVSNAYLVGDYESANIIFGDVPELKEKRRKIPLDAFFSPSSLYEREEKEREND